jgi:hypothetical protein
MIRGAGERQAVSITQVLRDNVFVLTRRLDGHIVLALALTAAHGSVIIRQAHQPTGASALQCLRLSHAGQLLQNSPSFQPKP